MTRQTFFRNLRKFAKNTKWKTFYNGIRLVETDRDYCPITFVAQRKLGKFFDSVDADDAGEALGLSKDDVDVIMFTADTTTCSLNHNEARTRKALRKAVGL